MCCARLLSIVTGLALATAGSASAQSRTVSTADMPTPGVSYISGPAPVRRATVSTGFLPLAPHYYVERRTTPAYPAPADATYADDDGYADNDPGNAYDSDEDTNVYYPAYTTVPRWYGGRGPGHGYGYGHGYGHGDDHGHDRGQPPRGAPPPLATASPGNHGGRNPAHGVTPVRPAPPAVATPPRPSRPAAPVMPTGRPNGR